MSDLLVIGVCSTDFIGRCVGDFPIANSLAILSSLTIATGGNALNTAIVASKIGLGVSLIGCIGVDYQGDFLESQMNLYNIDTRGIQRCCVHTTGSCTIMHNSKNERVFFTNKGANVELNLFKIPQFIIERANIVVVSGLFLLTCAEKQMSSFLQNLKKQEKTIIVDTSPNVKNLPRDYIDMICCSIAPYVDYFIPSEIESQIISNTYVDSEVTSVLHSKGFNNVIVKRAEKGSSISLNNGGEEYTVQAINVPNIIDSTGAGDAFIAGFAYALEKQYSVRDAVLCGNVLGSQCVQAMGATHGIDNNSLDLFYESVKKSKIAI